jgi:hypothetical protein
MEIKKHNINQIPIKSLRDGNISKNYTTHISVLVKVLQLSKGTVIECGGGIFSTPILHWLCKDMDRELITHEQDPTYYAFERTFQSRQHHIKFVENWDDIKIPKHVGMVFIDHHPPERRMMETLRFMNVADYIVIHDTERPDRKYNLPEVFERFKYRYDWKDCRPWTSVVSNLKDLSNL